MKMIEWLRGFKTVIVQVMQILTGAMIGSGFLTPEVGADITSSLQAVITSIEVTAGAFMALFGAVNIGVRAVTNTKIFNKP